MPILDCAEKHDRTAGPCHRWGVILAGGDGTRLRSLTRRISGDDRPKQFCRVVGNETLLHQTQCRLSATIPTLQTLVVLTRAHECFYIDQLNDLASSSLLIQPDNRGTAPAILYSLTSVQHLDPRALVGFFPSDHYFCNEPALHAYVDAAFSEIESHAGTVILVGISPETPEVGYGWIQPGAPFATARTKSIFHVDRFWEKPSLSQACSLMSLGCLWNSFIMVGQVQAFLNLIGRVLPMLFQAFQTLHSGVGAADGGPLDRLYAGIPTVNFSRQVLAACPGGLAVLRADGLGWSDLGEPGRVLSVLARKGAQSEWRLAAAAGEQCG